MSVILVEKRPVWPHDPDATERIHDTHRRWFRLLLEQGTPPEREQAKAAIQEMHQLRTAFPGSGWGPIEELTLPAVLVSRAKRVAHERQERAKLYGLTDQHALERTYKEEFRTVQAQYSLCIMLGKPFDRVVTHDQAKKDGNIGYNCSAVCPRLPTYGLIVAQDEHPGRRVFLVHQVGDRQFRCHGWLNACEAMHDEWVRRMVREDPKTGRPVPSRPWLPPNEHLRPLEWWFDRE